MTVTTNSSDPLFHTVQLSMTVPGQVGGWAASQGWGTSPWGTNGLSDPVAEQVTTLALSDMGYVATDGTVYLPMLQEAFAIDRRLTLPPGSSSQQTSWGAVIISNAGGQFSGIMNSYVNDHMPVTIRIGRKVFDPARGILRDPPSSDMVQMFTGVGAIWYPDRLTITVALYDATYLLSNTVQAVAYGGSGGLDGDSNVAGRLKPVARGWCQRITPVLIDAVNLIYQVSNGPVGFGAVYEGGYGEGLSLQGSTTDIVNASVSPGRYLVQSGSTGSYIKLGTKPVYAISIDVQAFWPSGADPSNLLDVVKQVIIEDAAVPAIWIDAAAWPAASAQFAYPAGWYWDGSASVTGQVMIDNLLSGTGIRIMPGRDGLLKPLYLGAGAPVLNLDAEILDVQPVQLDEGLNPPPYRWRLGYGHCFTPLTGSALHPQATAAEVSFVATADRVATWISTALLAAYRVANDPAQVVTALKNQADAQALAARHGALWGAVRRCFAIDLPKFIAMRLDIGSTITVTWPTPGLALGATAIVYGEEIKSDQAAHTVLVVAGVF